MIFTLVLIAIGAVLFLIIGYNVLLQYRQKQEADRKAGIAKHKAIISETEDLLLNSVRLPYSKQLVALLQRRTLYALRSIKQVDPTVTGLNNRIRSCEGQIAQLEQREYSSEGNFRPPDSDKEALQMLQVIKKLRAVVRSEQAKGKLDTQTFILEDRRLELMQLKVNIENAMKRAVEAQALRQWGTARQMLNRGISVVSSIDDRDAYLEQKLNEMRQMNVEMSDKLKKVQSKQVQDQEHKDKSDIDELFAPKKKW
jgi:hypothetical protein